MLLPDSSRLWPGLALNIDQTQRKQSHCSLCGDKHDAHRMVALKMAKAKRWLGGFMSGSLHNLAWALLHSWMLDAVFHFLWCAMTLFLSATSTSVILDLMKWLDILFMVAVTDCTFADIPSKIWVCISTGRLGELSGMGDSRREREICCTCIATEHTMILTIIFQMWLFRVKFSHSQKTNLSGKALKQKSIHPLVFY